MLTLSIVIEDRDPDGDLRAYHKHEVTEPAAILGFCWYLIRTPRADNEIVGAASRLMDEYASFEDMRDALDIVIGEKMVRSKRGSGD